MQTEMFPDVAGPRGFSYIPEFITQEEETYLLRKMGHLNWQVVQLHGVTARRKVVHFGYEYHFSERDLKKGNPPPVFLHPFIERAAKFLGVPEKEIAEVLITHYPIGAPIGWHLDAPMFEALLGISLLGSSVMKFRHVQDSIKAFRKTLEPRSAYIIRGEARWKWKHHIPPVKEERFSITFRTLKKQS